MDEILENIEEIIGETVEDITEIVSETLGEEITEETEVEEPTEDPVVEEPTEETEVEEPTEETELTESFSIEEVAKEVKDLKDMIETLKAKDAEFNGSLEILKKDITRLFFTGSAEEPKVEEPKIDAMLCSEDFINNF